MSDFYSGFEGEPEIDFVRGDQRFQMWGGYFDAIMGAVQPAADGWTSLAKHYHLETGWYDGPWKIDDLNAAIGQLQAIDGSALEDAAQVLPELVAFLLQARERHEEVIIEYS